MKENSKKEATERKCGRLWQYLFVTIGLGLFWLFVINQNWKGNSEKHTLLEELAFSLALIVGVIVFIRYYAEKSKQYLYIALGFVGTAFFDGYHGLVTYSSFQALWPTPVISLAPWSWNLSRVFLSVFMFLAWFAWREEHLEKKALRKLKDIHVYFSAAAIFVFMALFFVFVPFPRAYYPEYMMGRPGQIVSGAIFLTAMIGYYRKGAWRENYFDHMILISLLINCINQTIFMSFSRSLFDPMFMISHVLKIVSYTCVLIGILRDLVSLFFQVKEQHHMLEKEAAWRKQAEEQLLQKRKLEAIGNLAGGIAHDFNNQLLVIDGYADFLLDELVNDENCKKYVSEIKKAGQRSSFITKQLLAFSRKQVIRPSHVLLDTIVSNMSEMFERLLPDNIKLKHQLEDERLLVNADPIQIEHVITNLVVNARDAMPKGGEIEISAKVETCDNARQFYPDEIPPGKYVVLTIKDNGVGIADSTLKRILDPFYTTKSQGEGTGLGLSTSYGIIQQSQGFMRVESKSGKGTLFYIYLPSVSDELKILPMKPTQPKMPKGDEIILLVEDEAAVGELSAFILKKQGYHVIKKDNGEDALETLRKAGAEIDLLVTDVMMPGMNGRKLSREARKIDPSLRVIFMSGYIGEEVDEEKKINKDVNFLQKPFSADQLATKVRQVLDQK